MMRPAEAGGEDSEHGEDHAGEGDDVPGQAEIGEPSAGPDVVGDVQHDAGGDEGEAQSHARR